MTETACDNDSKARNGAESGEAAQNLARRLAVVVVTYRRQHLLGELFDSLAELTTHPWRIYVVDNENSQDTQTRVRDFGERLVDAWGEPDDGTERVVYLPQPVNVGCSAGFNAGMKRAYRDGAEWFWLVDDDVAVLPDAVETLAPWTDAHDVIQGARFDFFGEDVPQPRDLNVAFGTPVLSPPRFGRAGYRVTNVVSFEGALVKRSIVSAIGLPDPRFFITMDGVVYGYCASKVTNPIMIPAKVLRKTREKTEYDIAGLAQITGLSNVQRYHLMRNRGYLARYLQLHGDFHPFLFALGTMSTFGLELFRLGTVDRADMVPGFFELFKGWMASRRVMHDPDWKPMHGATHTC